MVFFILIAVTGRRQASRPLKRLRAILTAQFPFRSNPVRITNGKAVDGFRYCPTPPKPWPQSVKLRSKRRCRIWKPSVWRRSVRKLKPSWRVPRPSRKFSNSETCAAPAVKPGPEDDWPMVMILSALLFFLSVPSLIGLLVIYHVARPQKAPADTSNRINKVRLFWFALTREDVLAPHIPWLGRDELDNVSE